MSCRRAVVERGQPPSSASASSPRSRRAVPDVVQVVAQEAGIEHGRHLYRTRETTSSTGRHCLGGLRCASQYDDDPECLKFARPCFRPRDWARGFCRPPRRSRKRCCRWSTSQSSSTASKKPSPPASRTSFSSPGAARTPSRITSTSSVELETFLEARGKQDSLAEIRKISELINFAYVRQGEPLGLGHAVLVTRDWSATSRSPSSWETTSSTRTRRRCTDDRRVRAGRRTGAGRRTRARRRDLELRRRRGRRGEPSAQGVIACATWWKSHRNEEAPSDLAIIGRYVLTPDIFPELRDDRGDRTGEIQLTNGLRALLKKRPLYACEVHGVRHDTGNKLGFLKAVVYFALRRPDLAEPFAAIWNRSRSAGKRDRR